MSLLEYIKGYSRRANALLKPQRDPAAPINVLVVAQTAAEGWKCVEATVARDAITVLDARTVRNGVAPSSPKKGLRVVLVPEGGRSVCRIIDMANAAPDQVARMVSLRLEVELPYSAAAATWVCEPQTNGAGARARVLLIATATKEIDEAESEIRRWGFNPGEIEFAPTALAELSRMQAQRESGAIVYVDESGAALIMTHAGLLQYARHIRIPDFDADPEAPRHRVQHLAKEVKQSLYDYLFRSGNAMPAFIQLAGPIAQQNDLVRELESQLEMPVAPVAMPADITHPSAATDLLTQYPVCIGVLLAMQRRLRGERAAAPVIQRHKWSLGAIDWQERAGALIFANVVGVILLIASLFWVQSVRIAAADNLIGESRPLLRILDNLHEEVEILQFEDRQRRSMLDAMYALAELLPAEIQIETLTIDPKNKVTIKGKAKSVEVASDGAIKALETAAAFDNPVFGGATKDKDGFTFQITCTFRGARGPKP